MEKSVQVGWFGKGLSVKTREIFSKTHYEGQTHTDIELPHGLGKMIYENGNEYDGEWVYGLRTGMGVFKWKIA